MSIGAIAAFAPQIIRLHQLVSGVQPDRVRGLADHWDSSRNSLSHARDELARRRAQLWGGGAWMLGTAAGPAQWSQGGAGELAGQQFGQYLGMFGQIIGLLGQGAAALEQTAGLLQKAQDGWQAAVPGANTQVARLASNLFTEAAAAELAQRTTERMDAFLTGIQQSVQAVAEGQFIPILRSLGQLLQGARQLLPLTGGFGPIGGPPNNSPLSGPPTGIGFYPV